jgi:threonine dehydrogenase-like Zn-dependent dehydrogenase
MRAFVLTGPRESSVLDVEPPAAGAGQAVVDVHRAGVCGTDVEFFTGGMAYLQQGHAAYPLRPGHEWCGAVASVGGGVDRKWLGRRVTGDTMLGCGSCYRCLDGRQHLCELRYEIGVRGGWPGGLPTIVDRCPCLSADNDPLSLPRAGWLSHQTPFRNATKCGNG